MWHCLCVSHCRRTKNAFLELLCACLQDQRQVSELYCQAIVMQRGLRSVRDLRAEHVALLTNVRDKGCAVSG